MAETLKWMMELQDRMSGPAKTIANGLVEVREATDKAGESIMAIAEGMGLERLAEKAVDLGKEFVHALMEEKRFTDESRIGFAVLTGSMEGANDMLRQTRQFAINAGRPLEDVSNSYKTMLSGGIAAQNLSSLMNASADFAAIGGGSIQSWAEAFVNIQNPMRGLGQSLGQFRNALGEGGVDLLAQKLGFHTHGFEALRKQLIATPVSAQVAFKGLTETLMALEHGPLGTAGAMFADTMGRAIDSVKLEVMGLFEFGGEGEESGILKFMLGVRDALQPGGPLVTQIKAGIDAFLEGFGVLSGPGGFDGFLESLKNGTVLGTDFKATMRAIGDDVHLLIKGLGLAAEAVISVGKAVSWVHGAVSDYADGPKIRSSHGSASPGLDDIFENSNIRSKPQKFAEGGRVTGPTLALIGEGGEPETVIPDSKMGRAGGVTVHLSQVIHVAAEAGVSTGEIARKIHAIGVGELQAAFDSLALSMGTT